MLLESSASKSERDSVLPKSGHFVRLLNFDDLTTSRKSSDETSNCEIQFQGRNLIKPVSFSEANFWSAEKPAKSNWGITNLRSSEDPLEEKNFWSLDPALSSATKKYQSETRKFNLKTSERSSHGECRSSKPSKQQLILKTIQDSAMSELPLINPSQMEEILQLHINSRNDFTVPGKADGQRKSPSFDELDYYRSFPGCDGGFSSRSSLVPSQIASENICQQKGPRAKSKTVGKLCSSALIENELDLDQHNLDIISQEDTACTEGCPVNLKVVEDLKKQKQNLKLIIIDCRYHFEYKGSHIKSAINISSPMILTYLFTELKQYLLQDKFLDSLLSLEGREISIADLKAVVASTSKTLVDPHSKYR